MSERTMIELRCHECGGHVVDIRTIGEVFMPTGTCAECLIKTGHVARGNTYRTIEINGVWMAVPRDRPFSLEIRGARSESSIADTPPSPTNRAP